MRLALAFTVLALGAVARAEGPAAPVSAEPASYVPPSTVPHEVMISFQARYLSVDDSGQPSRGKAHAPLTQEAFLREVGRAYLAEEMQSTRRTKLELYVAGGLVAAAGLTAGIYEYATRPDLNAAPCTDVSTFNATCQPQWERKTELGAALLAGGLGVGAIVALVGWRLEPMPLSPFQARALANAHNSALWRELRGESQPLTVAPVVAPSGGGLALSGHF